MPGRMGALVPDINLARKFYEPTGKNGNKCSEFNGEDRNGVKKVCYEKNSAAKVHQIEAKNNERFGLWSLRR